MMDTATPRARAIALMREALTLLEATDHARAIVHLERAIDAAAQPTFLKPDAVDERVAEDVPFDRVLGRAIGGALAVIGTLLNKSGAVTIEEFASAPGIFAVVSGEKDDREGTYLGSWAAVLRELAEARPQPGGH